MRKNLHFFALALITFLAFINAISMDFVWDDVTQIKENQNLISVSTLKSAFLKNTGSATSNGEENTPYYRPLFLISLMLDGIIWGKNPFGYHLSNILMHLQVTFLVYLLLWTLLKDRRIAFSSALLFGIHPVHSEAVTYISARTHLLCALFFMLSFLLYLLGRREERKIYYPFSLLFAAFAMLSNEMGVTLPAIIIAYELCFYKKEERKLRNAIYYFSFALLFVALRFIILENSIWQDIPVEHRLLTGVTVIVKYLKILILPVGLNVFYYLPVETEFFNIHNAIYFAILTFHIFLAHIFWKKSKPLFFGLAWIFFTLLPVSNIPAVLYPSLLAERYLYLPSIGFSIIFGFSILYVANYLKNRMKAEDFLKIKKVSYATAAVLMLGFILITIQRNEPLRNEESLWERAVKDAPNSVYAHYRLALVYDEEGKLTEAKEEYEKTLSLKPQKIVADRLLYLYKRMGFNEATALYMLGLNYLKSGLYNSAIPFLIKSAKLSDKNASVHNALGIAFDEKGMTERAIEEFKKAIKLNPYNEGYRQNLEKVLQNYK